MWFPARLRCNAVGATQSRIKGQCHAIFCPLVCTLYMLYHESDQCQTLNRYFVHFTFFENSDSLFLARQKTQRCRWSWWVIVTRESDSSLYLILSCFFLFQQCIYSKGQKITMIPEKKWRELSCLMRKRVKILRTSWPSWCRLSELGDLSSTA